MNHREIFEVTLFELKIDEVFMSEVADMMEA